MSQKPQPRSSKRDSEMAYLEAELGRAYQFIDRLQQQNAQLQERLAYLEKKPLNSRGSRRRQDYSRGSSIQNSSRGSKRRSKGRGAKVSGLQFTAIALALAAGFASAGLAVTYLFVGQPTDSSVFPTPSPELPNPHSVRSLLQAKANADSQPLTSPQPGQENMALPRHATLSELVYNLTTPPKFKHSETLQAIVNELVGIASAKGLPTEPLSITLIDPRTGEMAGYKQDEPLYPASVVKMFWMVALYGQIENGILPEAEFYEYVAKMVKNSDNEAASYILDKITDTRSQAKLNDEKFKIWLNKREFVNRYFQKAGYSRININQKTYPVYSINLTEPRGTDLQMRGGSGAPIRNEITSFHAARLLYEICGIGQAVSLSASQKMCELLKRDLNPEVWKNQPPDSEGFNPVRGLLGEGLAGTDVQFYSKAGGTSTARLDAAFVATNDGRTVYILTVFTNDPAYVNDWQILPQMSRLAFDRMTARNSL